MIRSAFTLLELMLVMAILVLLSSIAVPILNNVLERQKLRGAAEELRLAWEGARLKAMRSGQAQVFQCEIETGNYHIQPLILHDDVNNVGEGATLLTGGVAVQTATTSFGLTTAAATSSQTGSFTLDESVVFVNCQVASDPRAYNLAQTSPGAGVNLANLSHSVVFYPDGTTSTAETLIRNERGDLTGVQIRGLTGHSRVLNLSSSKEAERP